MCLGEPAWRRIGLTCVSEESKEFPLIRVSLMGSTVLFPKGGCKLRIGSPFLEALGSALHQCAGWLCPSEGLWDRPPAPISLEGKAYSWDLGFQSLRSGAPWHTLKRAALLREPWGWADWRG